MILSKMNKMKNGRYGMTQVVHFFLAVEDADG